MSTTAHRPEAAATALNTHVFISYASEDRDWAQKLHDRLLDAGTTSVWMDQRSIEGGDEWKKKINEGLFKSHVVLALLTPRSVSPTRKWIRYEQIEALRLLRPVIPLLLEDCDLPSHLAKFHYVDFRGDWEVSFRSLRNRIGKVVLRSSPGQGQFIVGAPALDKAFVGRQADLEAVLALIDDDAGQVPTGKRAVAIQGMGGTGKTMLANELVRRLSIRYPGGVIVESRGQKPTAAEEILQKWAKRMLGKFPEPPWSSIDVRSNLQEMYGELLVLLDDVDERDFDDVRMLLRSLPPDATRLLTTRSENISSLGCLVYRIGEFGRSDAMAFLKNRLKGKGPLPPGDVLEKLIQILGGHALSLELTAANCDSTRDLEEDVEELEQKLHDGEIDLIALDVPGIRKQTSLALCLSESLNSLLRHRREWANCFKSLGIFPDGARLERDMIAAVWGLPRSETRKTLANLHKRALINRDTTTDQFYSHPILRAYAHGLLKHEPPRHKETRTRYFRYVIQVAQEGFQAPPEKWQRLEIYRPHLHQVGRDLWDCVFPGGMDYELLTQPDPVTIDVASDEETKSNLEMALEFSRAVTNYALNRPEIGETGQLILSLGLASARALDDDRGVTEFLDALGEWHEKRSPTLSLRYYDRALESVGETNDRSLEAAILSHKGELLRIKSRPAEALQVLEESLKLQRELNASVMMAGTLKSVGETHWRLGNHKTALEMHLEALAICIRDENLSGQGDLYNKIGSVRFNEGSHRLAIGLFEQALEIHHRVGNRSMAAEDLNDMAAAYRYLGDVWKALPALVDALKIHRETGARRLQAITMANLANIYVAVGLFDQALEMAEESLKVGSEVGDLVAQSWASSWQGQAYRGQGKLERALEPFHNALDMSREAENKRGEAGHLGNLGELHRDLGKPAEALEYLKEAVKVMETHGLSQAFGGRRIDKLKQLVAEVGQAVPGTGR